MKYRVLQANIDTFFDFSRFKKSLSGDKGDISGFRTSTPVQKTTIYDLYITTKTIMRTLYYTVFIYMKHENTVSKSSSHC